MRGDQQNGNIVITTGKFWLWIVVTMGTILGTGYGGLRIAVPDIAREAIRDQITDLKTQDMRIESEMRAANDRQDATVRDQLKTLNERQQYIVQSLDELKAYLMQHQAGR